MASIIPKIKVGLEGRRKSKLNLSFDCSTTANIGNIQPTMAREMVPNEKFKVKVSSLVRLASMPVPTFGRISLRHYHCYVPYIDLWQPFDSMMSGQHYVANGTSYLPKSVPSFVPEDVAFRYIMSYSDISIAPGSDISRPYTITDTNVDYEGNTYLFGDDYELKTYDDAIKAAQAADLARIQDAWTKLRNPRVFGRNSNSQSFFSTVDTNVVGNPYQSDAKGVLNLGQYFAFLKGSDATLSIAYDDAETTGNVTRYAHGNTPISYEGADLITRHNVGDGNDFFILFKFKAPLKRFRTIFIGLGYQFTPYRCSGTNSLTNTEYKSLLKLFAYYKCWFSLFRPDREMTFTDTACYKFMKTLSEDTTTNGEISVSSSNFISFLDELFRDCYYYLPMDYFSMAVTRPQQTMEPSSVVISSGASSYLASSGNIDADSDKVTISNPGGSASPVVHFNLTSNINPMTIQLAMKMLRWANKNTVIGRSIREYLRVHFGITEVDSFDSEGVIRIGSSRTNVRISDVMSTSESSEGYLGEYGGQGIGYSDSETFDFTAEKFGVWITLTVVVPESGYYQGYLKENRHRTRFDFFNEAFDCLGYQVLERGEIMHDWNCDNGSGNDSTWNPNTLNATQAFGFVPRYSEYKVGRNIVNGDLSLIGLYPSMAPYTLDRRFPAGSVGATPSSRVDTEGRVSLGIKAPDYIPTVVYDGFRRIDPSDHIGQYNRIFNYGGNDLDHFIIHNVFDVTAFAPMKPLSESFDTLSKDDDGTTEITHS